MDRNQENVCKVTHIINKLFLFQLEKQQKKLEAKGIHVELAQLRTEWEAARNGGKGGNNLPIEEHEIDVVGDDSDNEDEGCTDTSSLNRSPPPSLGGVNNNSLLSSASPSPPRHGLTSPVTTLGVGGFTSTHLPPFHPHNLLKLRNNFSIDNLLAVKCQAANLIKQEPDSSITSLQQPITGLQQPKQEET